ncbi:OmpA family protein [Pseudomonas sp. GW101-3H06]|uniref:OmpA family protein n=1 Tax=Pseudomonas sp. GW101-3H06 TaxID=2751347 RepID=UPI001A9399BC|nr:OmpA family protein [Pseudomonas sp. GW101-3H06]
MTALFEMRVRIGGDPRGLGEFVALHGELLKLDHPACPDVDWAKVEQLCLVLFRLNGADLQSAAAFTLARSQRYGLEGMAQGLALMDTLAGEWPNLWPAMASVREDILAWLFHQLQFVLRGLSMDAQSLAALARVDTELLRLQLRLEHQVQGPLAPLQSLRQLIESLGHRLQRESVSGIPMPLLARDPLPPPVAPIVIWPARPVPPMAPARRRNGLWLGAMSALIVLACGGWWGATDGGMQRLTSLLRQEKAMPAPVRLDSLALFDAGSAELKPGSTKVLINALVDIKAQPGWLIVISGHSDDRGDREQNLQLSHARASAVRGWMQRMGDIPDSCFAVQGVGASQPTASNDSASGRAANRRVDINLVPQAGACERPA